MKAHEDDRLGTHGSASRRRPLLFLLIAIAVIAALGFALNALLRSNGATFPNLVGNEALGNTGFPELGAGSFLVNYSIWIIIAFALVAFFSHFLFPSVRWFFRHRMERVVDRLNKRLDRPIQPFKLMERHDMIIRLAQDRKSVV